MASFFGYGQWRQEEDAAKTSQRAALAGDEVAQAKAIRAFIAGLPPDAPPQAKAEATARCFLVARDWDLMAAVEMLRNHLTFRAERFPIEKSTFIDDANTKVGAFFPHGQDRDGRRIVVVRSGKFQVKDRSLEANVASIVYQIEHLTRESGDPNARFTIVYDRTGFSIRENYDKDLLKELGALLSANYPERLEKALVYPCGLVMRGLWKVVQFFFDKKTREKVCMLGSPEAFAPHVDADQLPKTLGGTAEFGDGEVAAWYAGLPDTCVDSWRAAPGGGGAGGGGKGGGEGDGRANEAGGGGDDSAAVTAAPTMVSTATSPDRPRNAGGELNAPVHFYHQRKQWGEFSNFYLAPIVLGGQTWPTSEHYFQAMKFVGTDPAWAEAIRAVASPGKAAKMGRSRDHPLRADWEAVKDGVMLDACRAKFTQHNALGATLLRTGDRALVERTKNDSYWGDGGDGSGRNMLGATLEVVRGELRAARQRAAAADES